MNKPTHPRSKEHTRQSRKGNTRKLDKVKEKKLKQQQNTLNKKKPPRIKKARRVIIRSFAAEAHAARFQDHEIDKRGHKRLVEEPRVYDPVAAEQRVRQQRADDEKDADLGPEDYLKAARELQANTSDNGFSPMRALFGMQSRELRTKLRCCAQFNYKRGEGDPGPSGSSGSANDNCVLRIMANNVVAPFNAMASSGSASDPMNQIRYFGYDQLAVFFGYYMVHSTSCRVVTINCPATETITPTNIPSATSHAANGPVMTALIPVAFIPPSPATLTPSMYSNGPFCERPYCKWEVLTAPTGGKPNGELQSRHTTQFIFGQDAVEDEWDFKASTLSLTGPYQPWYYIHYSRSFSTDSVGPPVRQASEMNVTYFVELVADVTFFEPMQIQ